MSASSLPVVEVARSRTLLGVAVHDLVTDARIVDGLRVVAWPADGGRVTTAFQTASGAYAFRGLDGMARLEHPPAADPTDPAVDPADPPDPRPFVVLLTDRRARYLDTAFMVSVPTDGLVTRGDVLDAGGGEADDLPLYLFPSPTCTVPAHVAAVRAQVVDRDTEEPAGWCRVDVVVDPGGQQRRSTGLADADGNLLVTVPYPRFGRPAGSGGPSAPGEGELPDPGTQGTPAVERSWPVTVSVRCAPDPLERPLGSPVPSLDLVLGQPSVELWATTAGAPAASLSSELEHGIDLVLRTDGDPGSRLLIERAT